MTVPSRDTLERMRNYRTGLLVVVAVGFGVQCILAPQRQLSTEAYRLLQALGVGGWQAFGAALIAAALMLIPAPTRMWGHLFAAVVYLTLFWATLLHAYWPAFSILAGGLHLGEFFIWQRLRGTG